MADTQQATSQQAASERRSLFLNLAVFVGALLTGHWVLAARTAWRDKRILLVLAGLTVVALLFPAMLVVVLVTSLTSRQMVAPLVQYPASVIQQAKQLATAWEKAIRWLDLSTGQYHVGLDAQQIQEVNELNLNLSFGLLLALKEYGGNMKAAAKALSPSEMSWFPVQVTVSTSQSGPLASSTPSLNPAQVSTSSSLDEKKTSVKVETIWLLHDITTYNGHYVFQWKEVNGQWIVASEQYTQDYTPLYTFERPLGFKPEILDQTYLFRQALFFDPNFNDPALPQLMDIFNAWVDLASPDFSGVPNVKPQTNQQALDEWWSDIEAASQETGVPAGIIAAVMIHESGGYAQAFNPEGPAYGLMQLLPSTAEGLPGYDPSTWMEPQENLLLGAELLKEDYEQTGGTSWEEALCAYYGGLGTMESLGFRPGMPWSEAASLLNVVPAAYAGNTQTMTDYAEQIMATAQWAEACAWQHGGEHNHEQHGGVR
ncbi:lytic transglycosylase domain-containing protein [Alicyclobacillus sendaiensis]|uniref:Lytic transglycosylase domain-containing protein n=1 Tax=Alicyclobacillus sendaiensis PA2 TaxID=3029425 RepID=A0ABT6Y1F0_ALISE|nr:lytic transglycosylase domain-containing protein [Alicyclobacillus sendaiensis]MDI9261179.1 lytic transglycosylase domain-containing protein [Alicyclobacillus sendaiensis PA2]